MGDFIDSFLDRITMYRLVLYYLILLLAAAMALGFLGIMHFSPASILFSAALLVVYCLAANTLFAKIFDVPANAESVYITALILALIIVPPEPGAFLKSMPFLIWVSVWAMAGKYILNVGGKHLFNPAAFGVAMTAFTINQTAGWWVSTPSPIFMAIVALGGLLIIRKVRRFDVALAFLGSALLTMIALSAGERGLLTVLKQVFFYTPAIFFAAVMITEPLTIPPERHTRITYGFLVGWLFAPLTHFGQIYFTPELALLAGNIYSYAVSPKGRHVFTLVEKKEAGKGIYDFVFRTEKQLSFRPGQYMEWTLGLKRGDTRGNRRYFTLASSPTETEPLLGVKFYPDSSRFKTELLDLPVGGKLIGGQLAGDFTLPRNKNKKLVFVAGGIGITPFRSMVKYLLDTNQPRSVIILYANRTADEIAYTDILEEARQRLGIKTVYALSDKTRLPPGWAGVAGHFDIPGVAREIPDFPERTFYLSGSHAMVVGFKDLLSRLGVKKSKIKTDFFPGLA